ncbi:competence protein [Niabella pedocola]|uniref:Competence protein n=1 Tax=Niabella pedocola TaxID=1752077 RepID=A0ABS8PTH3_9BACT|nr:competence protein CoiA family protein [Niabella pedocola]MCD2424381.1 competence protein [Niabella pedocola]
MRFAMVDGNKVIAEPGLKGFCPGCSQPVAAKCGGERVHHWAHSRNKMCDTWWEPETEWHRTWKSKFPEDWQEIYLPDEQTGEKHIADVRTSDGFVIEFQHSHINPLELKSREMFYKNMAWVVDATRLKRDYPRFLKARKSFTIEKKGIFRINDLGGCFPSAWRKSYVPVIFDFRGNETISDANDLRHPLYCLFPYQIVGCGLVAEISRKAFINAVYNGKWTEKALIFMKPYFEAMKEREALRERLKSLELGLAFNKFVRSRNYPKRKRF